MDTTIRPTLSIVIPFHEVKGGADFLWKTVHILSEQSFQDYELVLSKGGTISKSLNQGIKRSRGKLIKFLCLDDHLAHRDALKDIVESFKGDWLVTASDNCTLPHYTSDIHLGNNKLGSPSALTILNDNPLLFDENLTWLVDCDYYKRMYDLYGEPVFSYEVGVNIGIHENQLTNTLPDTIKNSEEEYMKKKYA